MTAMNYHVCDRCGEKIDLSKETLIATNFRPSVNDAFRAEFCERCSNALRRWVLAGRDA